ncbi:LOW QUALITY PROTEIN: tyrosine-protein phosphatase non-receptor type 23 [Nilaparvata lugens]|uniref:LOW QUALITY PROTEIN: tyrosine-protein phosphatase non-receptor type 23 n=1 Tax=Nilaparvata lugens TaxID=108931 RepID=UPI00193D9A44|nr:LOW QUALITY PROTEIN: tyrosine-protein phosphatase non-receptor type 23 [Nilaparvata lugens]
MENRLNLNCVCRKDPYTNIQCAVADIRIEVLAILYNIGALHSQLGAGDDRSTADGLKMACTHFQCAAWAFQHLKDSYPQSLGVDVCPDLMQFMQQVCLAQAQECILEKSMTDNRKADISAKVAAQIVDYYNMAANALSQTGLTDEVLILELVGSKCYKAWKKYVKFKHAYYNCITLLYQGMQSEEQQKMGERVAYYQAAFDQLNEAMKLSNGLDQPQAITDTLAFTMDVVEGKRKSAKNDNDFIYHEKVPERDSLLAVKGASLVKGIAFSVNDKDIYGKDIFARLVPMKIHEASSLYSEEKAKLLRKIGGMVDEKDQELVGFISSLQVDYLNNHVDSDILPQELVDRCAALAAKPDSIQNLIDAMDKLSGIYHDVEGMLREILELIKIEDAAEKEYQEVMGSRPPSIVATDLTREANKYKEAHTKAAESNETLHKAMAQHIANLRVLSMPLSELQQQLPSISCLNLEDCHDLKEVRHLLSKVEEMRRQRSMLATQLRESICGDDITSQLVTRQAENLEAVFSKELEKHSQYVSLLEQNLSAQDNILKALTDAYAESADTRKSIIEILRQRSLMLSALMSSYDAYEDLIAKSNKGLEFYRKLETNVTKLLQRVKGTCKVQEEERETILLKNGKTLPSKLKLNNEKEVSGGGGLKLKDLLPNMKKDSSGNYIIQPALNQLPGQFNTNSVNYSGTHTSIPPTDSLPSESSQKWVPAVRPAPVGSEAPINSQQKILDSKPDISQNYYFPQQSNYATYDANYYARLAQSQAAAAYPSRPANPATPTPTHNPTALPNQLPSSTQSYQQSLTPSTQYTSVQTPYAYQNNPTYSNQPTDLKSQFGATQYNTPYTQSNYPKYKLSSTKYWSYSYNTGQQSAYYPQQGYNMSASPNHNATDQAKPNNPVTSAQPQSNIAPVATQNSGYPGSQTMQYSVPATYPSQSPFNNYNAYPGYSYPSSGQYQFGQQQWLSNSQLPSQNQQQQVHQGQQIQQNQSMVAPSQLSQAPNQLSQVPNQLQQPQQEAVASNQLSQIPMSADQLQQPQQAIAPNQLHQPQQALAPESKPWTQTSTQYSYNPNSTVAITNPTYTAGYSTMTTSPYQATAATTYAQYPHTYQPNPNYPQHLQYTPVADASHQYTRAGQLNLSQTNSSQTSLQGQTYAVQYNTNPNQTSMNELYYSQQYGYQLPQYNNTYGTPAANVINSVNTASDAKPKENEVLSPQSPMTYMQASNSAMTTTFSQKTSSSVEENKSNVDLLAGLDFSVSETPLIPEQSSQIKQDASTSSTAATTPSQAPVLPKPEVKLEEKITSMSLEPSAASAASDPADNLTATENIDSQLALLPKLEAKSKPATKDPYLDPEVLNQFAAEVDKFEKFVDGLTMKTLNGPTPLDLKWKELQDLQEKDSQKQIISVARCYPMKNRFPDILPYDSSRVELPSTKDDYINASHVKDISAHCPNFILTQAPLPSTYADFWTMIIEQQVEIIVCLLSDMEIGDDIYWPSVKGEERVFGKIKISLQSTNVRKHWVERLISVSNGRMSRVVVHLQFTEWPGSSLPASPGPLLSLVQEAVGIHSQQRGTGPVTVHCLSGVGRAGLFTVATAALTEIQLGHGLPDLVTLAAAVSLYRKNSLHNREHLKFAYQIVLYYAQDLLMKRGILTSRSSFEDKRPKSHTRHPSQDFLLASTKETSSSDDTHQSGEGGSTMSSGQKSDDPFHQIDALWPIKRFQ